MNVRLKGLIIKSGLRGYEIARKIGISDSRLSKLVNGAIDPNANERKKLAAVLGKPEKKLFPDTN